MAIFTDLVIAVAGDLRPRATHEDLKRWTNANGGTWSATVDSTVTHVICSPEAWKKKNQTVKTAQKLNKAFLVTYDWMENCLHKRRKYSEKKYSIEKVMQKDLKKKKHQARVRGQAAATSSGTSGSTSLAAGEQPRSTPAPDALHAKPPITEYSTAALEILQLHQKEWKEKRYSKKPRVEPFNAEATGVDGEGAHEGPRPNATSSDPDNVNESGPASESTIHRPPTVTALPRSSGDDKPHGYNYYTDHDGLTYNITLVRVDIRTNTNDRFQLRLYERDGHSDDYCVHLRYSGRDVRNPICVRLAGLGTEFEAAIAVFKRAFRALTGCEWEERDAQTAMTVAAMGSAAPRPMTVSASRLGEEWSELSLPDGMPVKEDILRKPFLYAKQGEQRPRPVMAASPVAGIERAEFSSV